MPTPAIAYLTQTLRASAGIVISASHNLFQDNGIKFFGADGSKLDDAMEIAIEQQMHQPMQTANSAILGKAARIDDAPGRYIEFCKSTIPSLTRLSGLKIVVDCANGATYHIAPSVFSELGADVISIGDKPDGFNINLDCGSTEPDCLRQKVLETNADIGIALDGDGDRLILIDAKGRLVNGDQVLYVIAQDRMQRKVLHGGVVGTQLSNYGLEKSFQSMNVEFLRARVGDRYVLELLKEKDWKIGGEPSGHVVCLDKTTTGDGIVAALQVLAIMIKQDKSLAELTAGIELFPQCMVNLKTQDAARLVHDSRVLAAVQALDDVLKDNGRVVLRASGTEPLLRVMVEGTNSDLVKHQAETLAQDISAIEQQLG